MIERGKWRDPAIEQPIDEAIVEVQPVHVDGASALRQYTRPSDGEAIRVEAKTCDQVHVLLHPVVMIGGDVSSVAVTCHARSGGETIPDRLAAPILACCALNLIGRGGSAPE